MRIASVLASRRPVEQGVASANSPHSPGTGNVPWGPLSRGVTAAVGNGLATPRGVAGVSPRQGVVRGIDDPMAHVERLASLEMAGRDSPSPGLDKAAEYIASMAARSGLEAPVPTADGNSHFQKFSVWRWRWLGEQDQPVAQARPRLFEQGFHLSESMSPEDIRVLEERSGLPDVPTFMAMTAAQRLERIQSVAKKSGEVSNVLAYLPGTGPQKDEVILVMAHYDHVGTRWGKVYPGANDNASGSAVLLSAMPELKRLQSQGKLNRSILFLWTAGEEKGLLGASHYGSNQLPGLGNDEIVGVINVDMVGRIGADRLSVIDSKRSVPNYFRGLVDESLSELDDTFTDVRRDIDFLWNRQDGAIFANQGEDVLMIYEGLTDSGGMNPDYHKTTDTIENLRADGGAKKLSRVRDLFVRVTEKAANRPISGQE